MSDYLIDVYKLAPRPDRMGLSCTDQGVCWGPLALVERQSDGGGRNRFVPRDQNQLERILGTAFGLKADLTTRMNGLRTIAKALNEGNLGRAQIVTLHLKLPPLPDTDTSKRLEIAEQLVKFNFDPNQLRDERGKWSLEGEASSAKPPGIPLQATTVIPFPPEMIIPLPPAIPMPIVPPAIGPIPIPLPDRAYRDRPPPDIAEPADRDKEDCDEEWNHAWKKCWELQKGKRLGPYSGFGSSVEQCARGMVS